MSTKKKAKILPQKKYIFNAESELQNLIEDTYLRFSSNENRGQTIRMMLRAGYDRLVNFEELPNIKTKTK